MKSWLVICCCGSTLLLSGQSTGFSKEVFVNEISHIVVDSSFSCFYLWQTARPCRFKKFDYEQLIKYALKEMVPLPVLNELAMHVLEDSLEVRWQQPELSRARCIGEEQIRDILNPGWKARYIYNPDRKQKKRAIKKAMADWEEKPPEEKMVFFFSKPVFTNDMQYAVIDLDLRCDTHECGRLSTCFFRRSQDHWVLVGMLHGG